MEVALQEGWPLVEVACSGSGMIRGVALQEGWPVVGVV